MSKNLNTVILLPELIIVLVTLTLNNTSPVCVLVIRIVTVTISWRYCVLGPIPKYLTPAPPVSTLESYPMIPPSIITPANNIGFSSRSSPTLCLAWRII